MGFYPAVCGLAGQKEALSGISYFPENPEKRAMHGKYYPKVPRTEKSGDFFMCKKATTRLNSRKQMSDYTIVFLKISCIISSKFSDSFSIGESCQEA